jgi:DNA-binding MarR family transcriptional regulator
MFTMMTDMELTEELKDMKLTKSQTIVLDILRKTGRDGVTPKQLLDKVSFAPRTVRYALRKLLKKNLIKRVPCLQDMRQWIYVPA